MKVGVKEAKSFIRRLKFSNRKYCSHSTRRCRATKVLVYPAESCDESEHGGKEHVPILPGPWGRKPSAFSTIWLCPDIILFSSSPSQPLRISSSFGSADVACLMQEDVVLKKIQRKVHPVSCYCHYLFWMRSKIIRHMDNQAMDKMIRIGLTQTC